MNIWKLIKKAYQLRREEELAEKDMAERMAIASAFNNRYTYRKEWIRGKPELPGSGMYGIQPRGGYAWMCPECNRIHHPTRCSVFDGLHYPSCCSIPEGNRCFMGIKV